ncbi:hypothetical protein M422DRAFT_257510 [Sphaerobolus stellatus SS14]|uniref:Unplaced genomic scaffold SPHSTscaffold_726, whole genome shotgun sequence n=1 Tax=Sphaerobolus stellatus (strain SS14) TaxID=990650 RepID=A0A0C9VE48_SPHS4|nr:hypothetical protein M422DRAFT_276382 [Sphaerobolus stellatus SS14]KIJ39682.1 hypothetical protein M422DRAFT_257510 [Sphaerobolus stellatus SS14]
MSADDYTKSDGILARKCQLAKSPLVLLWGGREASEAECHAMFALPRAIRDHKWLLHKLSIIETFKSQRDGVDDAADLLLGVDKMPNPGTGYSDAYHSSFASGDRFDDHELITEYCE